MISSGVTQDAVLYARRIGLEWSITVDSFLWIYTGEQLERVLSKWERPPKSYTFYGSLLIPCFYTEYYIGILIVLGFKGVDEPEWSKWVWVTTTCSGFDVLAVVSSRSPEARRNIDKSKTPMPSFKKL